MNELEEYLAVPEWERTLMTDRSLMFWAQRTCSGEDDGYMKLVLLH